MSFESDDFCLDRSLADEKDPSCGQKDKPLTYRLSVDGPPGVTLPFPPDPFSKFALDAACGCQPSARGYHKCMIYVGPHVD